MRKSVMFILVLTVCIFAETVFFDDFESGTGNWTLTGDWGIESGAGLTGTNCLTESPAGDYTADNSSTAELTDSLDLRTYDYGSIELWRKYDIEEDFDYMFLQISDDNGSNWDIIETWTGTDSVWTKETYDLYEYIGYGQVKLRFLFVSDEGIETDGMRIDDIIVNADVYPNTGPYIYYHGPENYEGTLSEFTGNAEVVDPDGVDSVWVEYFINFSETVHKVYAVNTIDNCWEFTIPDYGPGFQIDFSIWAIDGSEDHIQSHTVSYSYISGNYIKYDSDFISYYKVAGIGQAMAVRITPEIYAPTALVFALIRNYRNIDHESANMKFHVWSDNGGVPGTDLIEPFTVVPEATLINTSAFTRVDLSSYYLPMAEDFWIGISGFEGDVLSLMEAPYEEGTTAYERSYFGEWTGTEWNWTLDGDYNYNFRVIMGAPDGIEENSVIPAVSSLYQNYPNPFNPVTHIGFDLAKAGNVKLSVYNVNGQKISELINSKMNAGTHSVGFDGSKMNSGVYYYTLETEGKSLTRKMLMVK